MATEVCTERTLSTLYTTLTSLVPTAVLSTSSVVTPNPTFVRLVSTHAPERAAH